jgi:hypothetical protein
MQRHGGHLQVESELNQGSQFTLFFPSSRLKEAEKTKVLAAAYEAYVTNATVVRSHCF